MSGKDQLLEQIKNGSRNVRLKDLLKLMKAYDFEERSTKHGYLFKHDQLKNKMMPHVSKPHGKEKKVLQCYVLQCIDAIELLPKGDKKE